MFGIFLYFSRYGERNPTQILWRRRAAFRSGSASVNFNAKPTQ